MNNLVCSRETAEKMRTLGFPQKSLFYWCPGVMYYGYEGEWCIDAQGENASNWFLFDHVVGHEFERGDILVEWDETPSLLYLDEGSEEYIRAEKAFIKAEKKRKDAQDRVLKRIYSAYLAGEVAEWLPLVVDGENLKIWREKGKDSWDFAYNTDWGNLKKEVWFQHSNLSEAICLMLIHLAEQGVIDPKKL